LRLFPITSTPHCWRQRRPSLWITTPRRPLAYAAQEADLDREFWIDTDHLLRGLLSFPNAAADALSKLGVELEAMRAASLRNRQEFPPKPVPRRSRLQAAFKKFRLHLLLIAVSLIIFIYLNRKVEVH